MSKVNRLPIVRIDKSTNYQQWLEFRDNGIGASEVATILGMNQWKCSAELYYQKLGVFGPMEDENQAMFMGNELEPVAASLYEYWAGTEESMRNNKRYNNRVRTLYDPKCYVLNPEFPNLFFSPDRLDLLDFDHGRKFVVRGEYIYPDHVSRVVEIKTISGFAQKQYEDKFNPSYGIQLMTYLMGLGITDGSIFTMADGRNFDETTLKLDQTLCDQIVRATNDFWERVVAGREALELGGDVDQFAPPPDGSQAYASFLKKKYADPQDQIAHTPDPRMLRMAQEHAYLQLSSKELDKELTLRSNILKDYMGDDYNQIDFGPLGKVTWRANIHGTRTFRNMTQPLDAIEDSEELDVEPVKVTVGVANKVNN